MFTHAITRLPGENFAQGISTSPLGKPDYALMLQQHEQYVELLRALGLQVSVLAPLPAYPDAYFVEDVAVVIPETAVITRPGAAARRGEERHIEVELSRRRPIKRITAPGALDGGDVLQAGRAFFIGISERTNRAGAQQLGDLLAVHGYTWTAVSVAAGLHLKSSINYIGRNTMLVTPDFAEHPALWGYEKIVLDAAEAPAANTLLINNQLIMPQGFPKTRQQLLGLGLPIHELDVSEAQKMDGGLTCMSLRFT